MNELFFWYSHQEEHVRDCVLLCSFGDGSRSSASQSESGLGQSSGKSGLRVHRRPHGPTHRTPLEHRQVRQSIRTLSVSGWQTFYEFSVVVVLIWKQQLTNIIELFKCGLKGNNSLLFSKLRQIWVQLPVVYFQFLFQAQFLLKMLRGVCMVSLVILSRSLLYEELYMSVCRKTSAKSKIHQTTNGFINWKKQDIYDPFIGELLHQTLIHAQ